MSLLLGIDEGTSAVKAVVYDEDLKQLGEGRREKMLQHPKPGWVEQDPEEILEAVVGAAADAMSAAPGEVAACGLDHQGESVLAWNAETGEPITPVVTWQDKRSQEILDALEADGGAATVKERSGMPLDPYFSAGKLAWLMQHDEGVAAAHDAGTLRLGTVDSFLCDRLGAGFATDVSTASRTQLAVPGEPDWDDELLEVFGVPREALPAIEDTAGDLGSLPHDSWPAELPLGARLVDERPEGVGGLVPTAAWRVAGKVEYALDGGVFTAGALLEWMTRDLGLADDPPALAALAAEVEDSDGVRVLPALAGMGAPWWRSDAKAVIAGLTGRTRRGHVARAALEAIAWRVADVLAVVAEASPVEALRVDGGLTNDPRLLRLQADTSGIAVEPGAVDATAAGSAALAAVGAGIWDSTLEIGDRIPVGERVTAQRDDAWRDEHHAEWRRFVEGAAALG